MRSYLLYSVVLLACLFFVTNCKKEAPREAPTLTTATASNITSTSLQCGGELQSIGSASITALGVCWSTNLNPTIADQKTSDGIVAGSFTSFISGLNPGTTYYIRAYATNEVGTAYGNQVIIKTQAILPALTTSALTAVTSNAASGGGTIQNDGGALVTARGICWSINQNPTVSDSKTNDGSGIGSFISAISGLAPGTTYYVRSYATNSVGTVYGNQEMMVTQAVLPTLETTDLSMVTGNSAICGGNITQDGGGTITARGVCWSTNQNPTLADAKTVDGSGKGAFYSQLSGMKLGTVYYVRAYATNSQGTAYGNQLSFQTKIDGLIGSVTDIDGNEYLTVSIGSQIWMAENLRVTRFNDGVQIPLVTNSSTWTSSATPSYCWYNNDEINYRKPYGALYNWYTVNTGKLCPTGWHVPSDSQWAVLTNYLGDINLVGGKLKEEGTVHWGIPNTGASNELKYSAVAGGYRSNSSGSFFSLTVSGCWWSSTESNLFAAYVRAIFYNSSAVTILSAEKLYGESVRCIKD